MTLKKATRGLDIQQEAKHSGAISAVGRGPSYNICTQAAHCGTKGPGKNKKCYDIELKGRCKDAKTIERWAIKGKTEIQIERVNQVEELDKNNKEEETPNCQGFQPQFQAKTHGTGTMQAI